MCLEYVPGELRIEQTEWRPVQRKFAAGRIVLDTSSPRKAVRGYEKYIICHGYYRMEV